MPGDYVTALVVAALVAGTLALLLGIGLYARVARLSSRDRRAGAGEAGLAAVVGEQIARLEEVAAELGEQGERLGRLELRADRAVQRVGVVRFNPFEDTGSNQSFALALLDERDNGVVISSLHSRQGTRVYLKAIEGGRSETALSNEESEALRRAGAGPRGNA